MHQIEQQLGDESIGLIDIVRAIGLQGLPRPGQFLRAEAQLCQRPVVTRTMKLRLLRQGGIERLDGGLQLTPRSRQIAEPEPGLSAGCIAFDNLPVQLLGLLGLVAVIGMHRIGFQPQHLVIRVAGGAG